MSKKIQIIIFTILAILILIAVISVYFLISSKNKQTESGNQGNLQSSEPVEDNTNKGNNSLENETEPESNTESEASSKNEVSNKVVTRVDLSNETTKNATEVVSSDANIDELKKFLELYCSGIQRIVYNGETLESNTILLYLAKQYFDNNSGKSSSLKIDTTYASSVENIHKYLTELTGKDYTGEESIRSYKNYIGYSSTSNAYTYGSDISTLRNEKYKCTQLVLTSENDGVYVAKGQVVRTIDTEETTYDITLTFKINNNYKYQKYQIISLKPTNKSFYPDNTVRLVENVEE